jgi:hypothetical protein
LLTDTQNIITLDFVTITKLDEHLVENKFHSGAAVDVEEILKIKQANESLFLNQKYAVLAIAAEFSTITRDAQSLIASKNFVKNTVAKAILVQYLGQKIMGNFYLNFNKPHIKTKIFTEREKAIEWLYLQLKIAE